MRWVIAALVGVASATLSALAAVLARGAWGDQQGLDRPLAVAALGVGALAAGLAARSSRPARPAAGRGPLPAAAGRPWGPWSWFVAVVFAGFAFRAFCWLTFFGGGAVEILSPNNLGDLSRHLLYARYFAHGVRWWPEHPLHAWASLRYYPGVDLFQSLLLLGGADQWQALCWLGLLGAAAAFVTLRAWGGAFAAAGFLFNGGLAGFLVFRSGQFLDYQAPLAWKSLPLAIFVTQRGFLFALPAGLLLLTHWRHTLFSPPPVPADAAAAGATGEGRAGSRAGAGTGPGTGGGARGWRLPFWAELVLYVALPLFQLYAFLFLSGLVGWWLVISGPHGPVRRHLLWLAGAALLPVLGEVALMTNGFQAGHALWIKVGWMQGSEPFGRFWLVNFGLSLPLAAAFWVWVLWRLGRADGASEDPDDWADALRPGRSRPGPAAAAAAPLTTTAPATTPPAEPTREAARSDEAALAFVVPAGLWFLLTCVVMFAPWDWDNTKLMLWSYLVVLPFLFEEWVGRWPGWLRGATCLALFLSGFVSLLGGVGPSQHGYELISRAELDGVEVATRELSVEDRFACAPDYAHPLVLTGHKVAMGYRGALYSYGLDYAALEREMRILMRGEPGWAEAAERLGVRYLYWGPREQRAYPESRRPWETEALPDGARFKVVAGGSWGRIYDLATRVYDDASFSQ